MRTTVAVVNAQGERLRPRRGRPRRSPGRRGAGPDRGDRAVPHRHPPQGVPPRGDVPERLRPRGCRRRRGGRRGRHRHRGRRPRGAQLPVLPHRARAARPAWSATATPPCCSTTWACGWTARQTYSRDGAPVFGNFFGQSSLARHAIAYADNCVVVDTSVDLTKVAPYGCGFQTGAGHRAQRARARPRRTAWSSTGSAPSGLPALAAAAACSVSSTLVAVDPLAVPARGGREVRRHRTRPDRRGATSSTGSRS